MKLIAHSLVPTDPLPYMHLGYVSGVVQNSVAGGLSWIVLSCLLAVCIRKLVGKTTTVVTAAIIVVLLAGVLLFGYTLQQAFAEKKFVTTRYYVFEPIHQHIAAHLSQGKAMPADIQAMQKAWGLRDADFRDGWTHLIRVCDVKFHGNPAWLLQSAGPDGIFDTKDDCGLVIVYDKWMLTLLRIYFLTGLLREHSGYVIPRDMQKLQRELRLTDVDMHDYWGHAFIIQKARDSSFYELVSAGEDGKFGTPDDIFFSDLPRDYAGTGLNLPSTFVHGKEIAQMKGNIAHEAHRK